MLICTLIPLITVGKIHPLVCCVLGPVVSILGSHLRLGALLQAVPPHWSLLIFLSARGRLRMYGAGEFDDLQAGGGLQALMQAADSAGPAPGAQTPGLAAQGEHDVANADQTAASPDRQVIR